MPAKIEREHKKKKRDLSNKKRRDHIRVKNREERKKKWRQEAKLTQNARMIINIMAENKIRGSYKDYILIVGNNLIDWKRSYNVTIKRDAESGSVGVLIMHKKNLKNVLPAAMAAEFWHPTLGRAGATT